LKKNKIVVAVSGGFDPIHVGHIRYFQAAKKLGDRLLVILNTDEWLMKKKDYVFMPYEERAEILLALECVDEVVPQIDKDETVRTTLFVYRPDIFAKGGDRTFNNIPEAEVCEKYGIMLVTGVGGNKVQASSKLVTESEQSTCDCDFGKSWLGLGKN